MIGVGAIGEPMADRVLEAGIALRVYDVAPAQVAALAERGATPASSPAEAASGASVVGFVVRTDAQLIEAILGEQGALGTMSTGSVLVIQSTVLPATIEQIAAAASERGVGVVDAPITGGRPGAEAGTLVVMAGGSEADIETCRPFLAAMSKQIVVCGERGHGMIAKLCNNLVGYLAYFAAYEANQLASRSGLDPARLDEVLLSGGLMTQSMQGYLSLGRSQQQQGNEPMQQMLERITELAEKDLGHTLEAAAAAGLELPASALCQQWMGRVYGLTPPDES
jgi:3-hydroxyisobutyrate dehydrogenase